MVANNNINDGHNTQQTTRANNYKEMVFDGSGGQGKQWWRWCLMAAAMDDNKAVARQQRQRGGCNNQMKMMFDGGSWRGHLTVATMKNGNAVERSMAEAMDNSKAMARQDSEAVTEQE